MALRLYLLVFFIPFTIFATPDISQVDDKKVVLITGASRGIGWEAAKKLARDGHIVYASMRNPSEKSAETKNLKVIQLDVADDKSINKAIKTITAAEGKLDVLINNAGCAVFGPIESITVEQAKKVFEINFFGTMRLMQAVLPMMRETQNGLIINVSSTSGVRPSPGWDIYAASKFAMEGLSEAVAALVRQWNIRIVLLEPGATATEFMQYSTEVGNRNFADKEVFDRFVNNALKWMKERLNEGQPPGEVADVIAAIIKEDKFQLRYQTSPKGKQAVSKKHCDPTGEESIQEQQSLIK